MPESVAGDDNIGGSLELPVAVILRRARPLPPFEDTVIDDLTDEEQEDFWAAITR